MSLETPTCCGCLLNQEWTGEFFETPLGLTCEERIVLMNLKDAWDNFIKLDYLSMDNKSEYKDAIHRAQQIIALRVARRVDPNVWKQPGADD